MECIGKENSVRPKVSVIIPVYNVESYIEAMLDSVLNQSFKDFEVLLINDGSTDNSQKIIDKFCEKDSRLVSISKENGGVASARNLGIEKASGDFVVFYDPDDYIPRHALKHMYKTAAEKKADIVVGVMKEISLGEPLIYMHSQKLAKQNKINPLDRHFFGAWSLCHKMFSLDFIRKNNLRVEKLKNAEDGVFTFCALNCTDRIYGCDTVAYNYYKRPFWLTPSATQTISQEYLAGLLSSHDRILTEAKRLGGKYLSEDEQNLYLQKLYVRFIEGEMINGYYRGIFRASDDLIPKIKDRTEEYKKHITDLQWDQLIKRHRDLDLGNGFLSQTEIADNPIISVVIGAPVSEEKLHMILGSLYNQNFPRFRVILQKQIENSLSDFFKDKKNIVFAEGEGKTFKKNAMKRVKGEYVLFVDEYMIFTKNTLIQMEKELHKNEKLDFVSVIVKNFDGKNYKDLKTQNAAFGFTGLSVKNADMFTYGDIFMANKLIRMTSITDFKFSNSAVADSINLYKNLNFKKLRKGIMITDATDREIRRRQIKRQPECLVRLNAAKNITLASYERALKRVITREDIDKFKKAIGKK